MRNVLASFILAAFVMPVALHAQSVPDAPLPSTVESTPESQVVSAITGRLPSEQNTTAGNPALINLDYAGFIGSIVSLAARNLTNGSGNTAVIDQQGNNNTARINQTGQRNVAVMVQQGDFNTSLLTQEGSNNVYGSWLQGDNNYLNVQQVGDNNSYLLGYWGNDLTHTVQQIGNNIKAVQVGVNYKPFGIQQRGSGMDITIRHNGAQ